MDPRLPEGTYSTPELTRAQLLAAGRKKSPSSLGAALVQSGLGTAPDAFSRHVPVRALRSQGRPPHAG